MVQIAKAEYLGNNIDNLFSVKKNCTTWSAWKIILEQRNLIMKGLKCILDNGNSINFGQVIWLIGYTIIEKLAKNKIN